MLQFVKTVLLFTFCEVFEMVCNESVIIFGWLFVLSNDCFTVSHLKQFSKV